MSMFRRAERSKAKLRLGLSGVSGSGKTYSALRRLGFAAVFDTNFGADLTIMEEGAEFVERFVKGKGALPLITSCCPSWTDYMEKYAPDFIENDKRPFVRPVQNRCRFHHLNHKRRPPARQIVARADP